MKTVEITRILDGSVRGSSRPIIADTIEGKFFIKLRGASQGCGALIAELIVAELAKTLELNILPAHYAYLKPNTPTKDKNDELADLLQASSGLNLAFPFLEAARDIKQTDLSKLTRGEQAATLWLDRLVMNPDRNTLNPNLLYYNNKVFLIDHGASLRFQYNWSTVKEDTPQKIGTNYQAHLFEDLAKADDWKYWEELFSDKITRQTLQNAVNIVPDDFIRTLEPKLFSDTKTEVQKRDLTLRRREAYIAFLWKRLKAPRCFAFHNTRQSNYRLA